MEPRQLPPKETSKRQQHFSWILLSVMIWLVFVTILNLFSAEQGTETLSYTAFKEKVRSGVIKSLTIKGQKIYGEYNTVLPASESNEMSDKKTANPPSRFMSVMPPVEDASLLQFLEDQEIVVRAEEQEPSLFWNILLPMLPWLLIIGFFVYSSRKMQERLGGGASPFSFAKSKAKLYSKPKIEISFKDVAGLENAKQELMEMVDFLRHPEKYQSLGAELPNGLLLVGPPGVGKTLLAQATAGEAGVTFYSISGSEFIEMFVGVGASRVRDMFKKAKKDAPTIIFIDELDSIGRSRGTGLGGGHDEREQTLNQILSEMDGFSPQESVIVIAATNRPDVLDPALIRPGRFDRQITLDRPYKQARLQILELHCQNKPMEEGIDLEGLASRTVGFSGADLKNLVNEAVLLAARKNREMVTQEDFEESRDKIILGIAREDLVSEEEKEIVACHEAGHTLIALLIPGADPIKKVTIIPHGQSLGATEQIPAEDQHNLGRKALVTRLMVLLGGQAAEDLIYQDTTTGAGDDLKKATELARRMITEWGMSKKLGPVAYKHGSPHPFLGRELAEQKDFSEQTAWLIDQEVQSLLAESMRDTTKTLEENRDKLERLQKELLEKETLTVEEIQQLLGLESSPNS